jgi:cyclophilin family peptidyl-prolyl cis-trans isomerase
VVSGTRLKKEEKRQKPDIFIFVCRFGPGPYYFVELHLDLPAPNTILLETAHLDAVPHSIQLFLEQVSHGLYDNTAFHLNAPHKLQAGPSSNPQAHQVFRQHPSLNSILFQEYNPTFPHTQYTVGYAGRPGGPDFYINMKDNTNLHSLPSYDYNDYHNQDQNLQDPCFARVVAGVNVLQRLRQQPVGWEDVLLQPVTIQRMRVLSEEEYERLLAATNDRASEY